MSVKPFDMIVVGGGMIGSCVAIALANKGLKVAIIETSEPLANVAPKDKLIEQAPYDLRVSAISPSSREFLERLMIWQQLDPKRVCEYQQMRVWHQGGQASVEFDAVELGRENLGAIVENVQLQRVMRSACEAHSKVEWFRPDRVEALLENDAGGVSVRLESGLTLQAGLLIAADGRNSPTRELAGFEVLSGEYKQTAIVANVTTELPHQEVAWQRFLSTGPLAFLPLANGQSSIVWSCDNEFGEEIISASDEDFCSALAQAFEHKLGEITNTSQRASFKLGWHRCERWLENRILLLGDAAHSVHPLAGQGLNLGFSDVEVLIQLCVREAETIKTKNLRRFERQRKSETWLATQSFSGLKWFYGVDQQPWVGLRDAGMQMVAKNPMWKRALMQAATQNIS